MEQVLEQSLLLSHLDGSELITMAQVSRLTRRRVIDYIDLLIKKHGKHRSALSGLSRYPRLRWKLFRAISQIEPESRGEAAWAEFVALFKFLVDMENKYDEAMRDGIVPYNGFPGDMKLQLAFYRSRPNFWWRRHNCPTPEERLASNDRTRLRLIRERMDAMRLDVMCDANRQVIYGESPNWLVILEARMSLLEGRCIRLHIYDLSTGDSSKVYRKFKFNPEHPVCDGTPLVECPAECRQINGHWFYFSSFNHQTRRYDLAVIDLRRGKLTVVPFGKLEKVLARRLVDSPRPHDVNPQLLELKNDNVAMNSAVFNYSARLRRVKRRKRDDVIQLEDKQIYSLFADRLKKHPESLVMGVRYDSPNFEEYMLLVARIDQSALVIDELITVNQGYLGEYEV